MAQSYGSFVKRQGEAMGSKYGGPMMPMNDDKKKKKKKHRSEAIKRLMQRTNGGY